VRRALTLYYDDRHRGELSSLALAHVGDAVFELLVRTALCADELTAERLHRRTIELVCAPAQARAASAIADKLSDEEQTVFRRARNAKSHRVPHGCTPGEYALSTALEALFGSLYLGGKAARVEELFEMCWEEMTTDNM
jgi:ribonuclease-3 family protein